MYLVLPLSHQHKTQNRSHGPDVCDRESLGNRLREEFQQPRGTPRPHRHRRRTAAEVGSAGPDRLSHMPASSIAPRDSTLYVDTDGLTRNFFFLPFFQRATHKVRRDETCLQTLHHGPHRLSRVHAAGRGGVGRRPPRSLGAEAMAAPAQRLSRNRTHRLGVSGDVAILCAVPIARLSMTRNHENLQRSLTPPSF